MKGNILIISKLTQLRAIEPEDLTNIRKWRENAEVNHWLTPCLPLSRSDQEDWHSRTVIDPTTKRFIIETRKGVPIGLMSLMNLDVNRRSVEVGIYIGETAVWGQGYAKDALLALVHYSLSELGLHRIWAEIIEDNAAALALFQQVGFQQEGCLRDTLFLHNAWRNSIVLGILHHDQE